MYFAQPSFCIFEWCEVDDLKPKINDVASQMKQYRAPSGQLELRKNKDKYGKLGKFNEKVCLSGPTLLYYVDPAE